MYPILGFPPIAGMSYPTLDQRNLVRIVPTPADVMTLPEPDRQAVRVLMTSASRGCSVEVAAALPHLSFVISQGVGQDKIAVDALKARGITLRSVGETVTEDVADLALALTQMLCRDLLRADAFVRNGQWEQGRFDVGHSLFGMTIGIAGLSGRIGQAIAARARVSGMAIAGLNRRSNQECDATLYDGWVALAQASDVLVLAVPGSDDLHHVINEDVLRALGPQGRLINVGRGSLVDTDALIVALESGTIAGAALDVIESEPKVPARLVVLPNVVLTPHMGAQTWGQRARAARIAQAEVLAFLEGL